MDEELASAGQSELGRLAAVYTTTERTRRRGRPLDPALDKAVLSATVELLGENGYSGLRVGDVAQRAGTGLGTLYRRWPTKRDLVLAALEQVVPDRHLPVTDDPSEDLLAGWSAMSRALAGRRGRLLGRLLPELNDDPDLADAIRRVILASVRHEARDRLRRVVGERPDLDLLADLAPAYILFQSVFLGRQTTGDELRMLRDVVTTTD